MAVYGTVTRQWASAPAVDTEFLYFRLRIGTGWQLRVQHVIKLLLMNNTHTHTHTKVWVVKQDIAFFH